jgi:hypothetical protein
MIIAKRRVVSVKDVTAQLDALAHSCSIANPRYDESESDSMSEFDALEWICLCSQRLALLKRENETASRCCAVPPRLLGIYETKPCFASRSLENSYDGLNQLAA